MKSRFDGLGDMAPKAKAIDAATSRKRAVKAGGSGTALPSATIAAKPTKKPAKRSAVGAPKPAAEARSFEIRVAMTFTEDDPVGAAFAKMLAGLPRDMAKDFQLGRPFKRAVLKSLEEIAAHLK